MEHQGIANLLLSKEDVDADARDDYGRSPLSLAAEKGDEALACYFSSGKTLKLSPKDKWDRTPFSWVKGWDLVGLSIRRQLLEHKSVSMENIPTLNAVFELGNICRKNGMFDEADKMYKRAIERKKKVASLEHLSTLDSIHHLGTFYADEGMSAEAEEMLENVLKAYERTLGPEDPATFGVVHDLGHLHRLQGNLSDAEKLLQRAVNAREKSHGSDHSLTTRAVYNLGLVYQDQGKLRQAEEMYQKALSGLPSNLRLSNIRNSYRVESKPGCKI
jgi:tetratricopeptide (TPR) repeat protein